MHYADIKPNFYEAFRVAVAVFLKLNCENLNIALVCTHTHTGRSSDSQNDLWAAIDKALILKAIFKI